MAVAEMEGSMHVRWSDGGGFAVIPVWVLEATIDDELISDKAIRLFAVMAAAIQSPERAKQLSLRSLRDMMGCATSTVSTAVQQLQVVGALTVEERQLGNGGRAENAYVLHAFKSDTPPDTSVGGTTDTSVGGSPSLRARAGASLTGEEEKGKKELLTPPTDSRLPQQVGKRPVTTAEAAFAFSVLTSWNEQTGQNLTSGDWLSLLIRRHREHPELDADAHAAVIAACLVEPWWDGPPNPSVVYGNGAQFERSLLRATSEPTRKAEALRYGRGLTTKQTAALFGIEDRL
jgi:hypothetical protein